MVGTKITLSGNNYWALSKWRVLCHRQRLDEKEFGPKAGAIARQHSTVGEPTYDSQGFALSENRYFIETGAFLSS